MGQLHRARVRVHRLAAVLVVAAGCSSAPTVGTLPSSPHYHALAAAPGRLLLATHTDVYASADGRAWEPLGVSLDHPLAVAMAGGRDVAAGLDGVAVREGDAWSSLDDAVRATVLDQRGRDVVAWSLGDGLVGIGADLRRFAVPTPRHADDHIVAVSGDVTVGPSFGVYRGDEDLEAPVPMTAAAAADDVVFTGSTDGVWRHEHGRWDRLDLETAGPVAAIASDADAVWVLAQGGQLSRSDDGGATWDTVATS